LQTDREAGDTMTAFDLPAAFYRQGDDGEFEPSEATIGPWSPDFQHGGPPCALLVHALRTFSGPDNFKLTRIAIEILAPVPVQPCTIKVTRVRGGKRVELLEGRYFVRGKPFLLAHAWRFESQSGVTKTVADTFAVPDLPGPQIHESFRGALYFPYEKSLEWRFVRGGYNGLGPCTVWTRPRIPLIDGLETNGLEALILMLDSANGISAELDFRKWSFVPVDLTIALHRQPIGPWVGMDARTIISSDGIGQSTTIAFDHQGSVGHSLHTLFIRPR
jgi:Acyl-CoA thioesterase C-terminal domain/Acyl-CoA thioesterase N-terminal domain